MRESEDDATFETFFLIDNPRINPSIVLVRAEILTQSVKRFAMFNLLQNAFIKLCLSWLGLIVTTPCTTTPPQKFPPKNLMKNFLGKNLIILERGDTMVNMYT